MEKKIGIYLLSCLCIILMSPVVFAINYSKTYPPTFAERRVKDGISRTYGINLTGAPSNGKVTQVRVSGTLYSTSSQAIKDAACRFDSDSWPTNGQIVFVQNSHSGRGNVPFHKTFYTEFDNISPSRIWYIIFWNNVSATANTYIVKDITVTVSYTLPVLAPTVTSIYTTPSTPQSLQVGSNQQFQAKASMSDGTTQNITSTASWSSSNPSVLSSQGVGSFSGIGAGQVTVKAQYQGFSSTVSVTVTSPTPQVTVTSINLIPGTPQSLQVGSNQQFQAYANMSNGTTQNITSTASWSSSNSSVLSSQGLGSFSGIGAGQAIVQAQYQGFSSTVSVTVTSPIPQVTVTAINLTPGTPQSLQVGNNQQFQAKASMSDGTTQNITSTASWSSSNPSVLSSQGLGSFSGIGAGQAIVQAQYQGFSASVAVTVNVNSGTPASPSDLFALVIVQNQIRLTWNDNADNESGFRVYRNGALVADLLKNTDKFEDMGLVAGRSYSYRIVAYNSAGESYPGASLSGLITPTDTGGIVYAESLRLPVNTADVYRGVPTSNVWYDIQPFGARDYNPNRHHLGGDLNKNPDDLDEPLYMPGNALLVWKGESNGWGRVYIFRCTAPPGKSFITGNGRKLQSVLILLGHLYRMEVQEILPDGTLGSTKISMNDMVAGKTVVLKGWKIGTVGAALMDYTTGAVSSPSHLHFGVMEDVSSNTTPGLGYKDNISGWYDPIEFVRNNTYLDERRNLTIYVHSYDLSASKGGYISLEPSGSWTDQVANQNNWTIYGYNNYFLSHIADAKARATWHPRIPVDGIYQFDMIIPQKNATAIVKYSVYINNKLVKELVVDQSIYTDKEWISLGNHYISTSDQIRVEMVFEVVAQEAAADTLRLTLAGKGQGGGANPNPSVASGGGGGGCSLSENSSAISILPLLLLMIGGLLLQRLKKNKRGEATYQR